MFQEVKTLNKIRVLLLDDAKLLEHSQICQQKATQATHDAMTTPNPLSNKNSATDNLLLLSLLLLFLRCHHCQYVSRVGQPFRPRGCRRLRRKESVLSRTRLDEKGTEEPLDKTEGPYQRLLETRGVEG